MKVFFISTPRGNSQHINRIYKVINNLGYTHTSNFHKSVNLEKFYTEDDSIWQERYKSRLKEIAAAEICIFEVSQHSFAVGQLVQEAIRSEKPTILLYYEGQRPYFFRGAEIIETRVHLLPYTLDKIEEVLKYAFEIAEELLTTRFTMLITPEITKFLDDINNIKGIARSEFIRNLLVKEMNKKKK
jgi:hypothetical protein